MVQFQEIIKVWFHTDGNIISLNSNVIPLFSSTNKEVISKWINDYIEYALLRYDEEFGRKDFGFPFLKPYAKYSMRNIAPLLFR